MPPRNKKKSFWQSTARALGLLLLGGGLALPAAGQQPGQEDAYLRTLTDTYRARLENTFRYQQAVLPGGYASVERSLQAGKKHYRMEYALKDLHTGEQVREEYGLRFFNHDTVSLAQARYVLSGKLVRGPQQLGMGAFTEYRQDIYAQAGTLLLSQTFDPVAVLSLAPGAARTGQVLYVRNATWGLAADTLASYYLLRAGSGDTCQVTLSERADASRPWHGNSRVACSWRVELTRRRLTAEQLDPANGTLHAWVRTYSTATDFVEEQTDSWVDREAAGGRTTRLNYRRHYRQLSRQQALDTYAVVNGAPTGKPFLTFSISSLYH